MPFLSGSLAFERFSVATPTDVEFTEEHIEKLQAHAAGQFETAAGENTQVGFLGGSHLFDQSFDYGKNVINEALHAAVRIDSNSIPAAIRNAWLQMELSALGAENDSGRPTKAQRKEAKESVEQRCEAEVATGKYKKMQQFPVLWDARDGLLYCGGSGASIIGHCADLFERVFAMELHRFTVGSLAQAWAIRHKKVGEVDDLRPAQFVPAQLHSEVDWCNEHSTAPDFLGNEFLTWLWWTLDDVADTLTLEDESEVTAMMTKTLTLECPMGETGKETLSSECPTKLPEALEALRNGKLPRKTGLTVIRHGQQFDMVLQAESFAIGSAKIHTDESSSQQDAGERIDAIRSLTETVDLLFFHFLERRIGSKWQEDLRNISKWLGTSQAKRRNSAA